MVFFSRQRTWKMKKVVVLIKCLIRMKKFPAEVQKIIKNLNKLKG